MLATQLNDMVEEGALGKNAIVRLKKFHASRVGNNK